MNLYEELGKIQLQLESLQAQANQLVQKKQEIIGQIVNEQNTARKPETKSKDKA